MGFLHINTKNYKDNDEKLIKKLNHFIHSNPNNKVFILYYMEGCIPCNATRPEWSKLKQVMKHLENNNNILIVDIDQNLAHKIKGQHPPSGFPTMRFITKNGKIVENYEDSNIDTKDRTIDSFVIWIKSKTKYDGKINDSKNNRTRKNNIRHIQQQGGKWSKKYKRSINCRRPRGFSQKQYCKYGKKG
jgi:hypothetical protein